MVGLGPGVGNLPPSHLWFVPTPSAVAGPDKLYHYINNMIHLLFTINKLLNDVLSNCFSLYLYYAASTSEKHLKSLKLFSLKKQDEEIYFVCVRGCQNCQGRVALSGQPFRPQVQGPWGRHTSHARAGCSQVFRWVQNFFRSGSALLRTETLRQERKRDELSRHLTDPGGRPPLTQPCRVSLPCLAVIFYPNIFMTR